MTRERSLLIWEIPTISVSLTRWTQMRCLPNRDNLSFQFSPKVRWWLKWNMAAVNVVHKDCVWILGFINTDETVILSLRWNWAPCRGHGRSLFALQRWMLAKCRYAAWGSNRDKTSSRAWDCLITWLEGRRKHTLLMLISWQQSIGCVTWMTIHYIHKPM